MRLAYLIWIAITFGALFWWDGGDTFRRRDNGAVLREAFHLPADVPFSRLSTNGESRPCSGGNFTGEARLTPKQAQRYVAAMGDPNVWRPLALAHFNTDPAAWLHEAGAFEWGYIASARQERAPGVTSFDMAASEMSDIRQGRYMCFAIRTPGGDLFGRPEVSGYSPIKVGSCNAGWQGARPEGWGIAAFDPRTLTLKMHLSFSRPAAFCTKSRRAPLFVRP
jgi:hypothetical protein